jgi:hypothetical protein
MDFERATATKKSSSKQHKARDTSVSSLSATLDQILLSTTSNRLLTSQISSKTTQDKQP